MTSDVAEYQEEFEDDDPTEDEGDENDSNSLTDSEAGHPENRSDKRRSAKSGNDAIHGNTIRGVSHAFTVKSKARTPKCMSNMIIKPNNPNINFLKNL